MSFCKCYWVSIQVHYTKQGKIEEYLSAGALVKASDLCKILFICNNNLRYLHVYRDVFYFHSFRLKLGFRGWYCLPFLFITEVKIDSCFWKLPKNDSCYHITFYCSISMFWRAIPSPVRRQLAMLGCYSFAPVLERSSRRYCPIHMTGWDACIWLTRITR